MVKIRLRRIGTKARPFYRVVVAESSTGRNGAFVETLGTYDPTKQPNLFDYGSVFQSCQGDETSTQLDADLAAVSTALANKHINLRIYATDVAVQGSKWTN